MEAAKPRPPRRQSRPSAAGTCAGPSSSPGPPAVPSQCALARQWPNLLPRSIFSSTAWAASSDLRGAVVVVDVLARVIAACRTLVRVFRGLDRSGLARHDHRSAGGATGAHCQEEVSTG